MRPIATLRRLSDEVVAILAEIPYASRVRGDMILRAVLVLIAVEVATTLVLVPMIYFMVYGAVPEPESQPETKPGHGKRTREDYAGADQIICSVPGLTAKSLCPELDFWPLNS